jgi:hypothetical protein
MKKLFVILFSLIMISGVAALVAGADGADFTPKYVPASTTDTTASDADASATDADAVATTSSDADAASATDADAATASDADAATATEPTATEPTATEPTATEPTATEPTATEPTATEPTATEPTATEPTATEPTATEPTATEPTATEPTETEPTAETATDAEPAATSTDADAATATDADAATSTDADAETPTDADAATSTDADAETPTDADAETPTDADAETPTDATETETKPTHKHTFRTIAVIGATCTEEGEVKLYCDCGDKSSEKIPALGHDFVWKNNGNGTETQYCSRCNLKGETRPVETEPVHEHSYSREVTKAPTCTAQGEAKLTCECGDTKTQAIPALGHSFGNYIYNNDATYDDDGTETATCSRCGEKTTRTKAGTKLVRDENDTALADAKAAAKKAIDDACPNGVSDEVLKIAEEAKKKIDKADSLKKVEEEKNNGLTLIQEQRDEDCHYCGLDHSGFPGIFVKVFHAILNFFRNLFNR